MDGSFRIASLPDGISPFARPQSFAIAHPCARLRVPNSPPGAHRRPAISPRPVVFVCSCALIMALLYLAIACVPASALTRGSFLFRANSGSFR